MPSRTSRRELLRLSTIMGVYPASQSAMAVCEPMYPRPPVRRIFLVVMLTMHLVNNSCDAYYGNILLMIVLDFTGDAPAGRCTALDFAAVYP